MHPVRSKNNYKKNHKYASVSGWLWIRTAEIGQLRREQESEGVSERKRNKTEEAYKMSLGTGLTDTCAFKQEGGGEGEWGRRRHSGVQSRWTVVLEMH